MQHLQLKGKQAIIRQATKSDAKALLNYLDTIGAESDFLTFGKEGLGITLEDEEAFIESNINKDNTLFLIAEIEGKIIGNLNFTGGPRPRTRHTGEFGVTVLKEYWGHGLGTALITYLLDWAKFSGVITKINLQVRTDHHTGIKLYKKLGFVQEGLKTKEMLIDGKYYDMLLLGRSVE